MTDFPIHGGCLCGGVRYTIDGPAEWIVHCHCSECRRSYASLVGTGATIDPALVKIDQGEELLTTFEMPPGVRRQFCRTCGCSLFYFHHSYPRLMFYFPATLDDGVHPGHRSGLERHIFTDSKAEWGFFDADLPRHGDGWPGEEYPDPDK